MLHPDVVCLACDREVYLRAVLYSAFGLVLVVGLWLIWARNGVNIANQHLMWQGSDTSSAGDWGDAFGGFNALFGAVGSAAVIITLIVQGQSLKQQQLDQHRQNFDATFFQLLRLLRELRSEIRYARSPAASNDKKVRVGGEALKAALFDTKFFIADKTQADVPLSKTAIGNLYAHYVHSRAEDALGPYFRVIYTILRRIDQDKVLTTDQKVAYANLLRGQLGSPEVELIAVNALSKASKDFGYFVRKYRIPRYAQDPMLKKYIREWYGVDVLESRLD